MKILWLTNIPSPYRVKFFNELGKFCELTVLFERRVSSERDNSWQIFTANNFTPIFLKGKDIGVAEAFCPLIIKHLNKKYDHIVVTNYSDPTGVLAILWMKLLHISYEIEGDGAFPGRSTGWKTKLKRFLIKSSTLCFSSAKMHDKYYRICGVPQNKIVRYPFTSICESEILSRQISKEEKKIIKKRINVTEAKIILAIGQFIARKGYDILIEAFAGLNDNCGLYIIGGKVPGEYYRVVKENNIENIHFLDFILPDQLKDYYQVADVFVHPTREDIWGLVINEAMAHGLPVITTNKCIAGLEMVKSKENGEIVEANDVVQLRTAIKEWLENGSFNIKSIETAKKYTIENMSKVHISCWKNIREYD